MIFHSWTSSSSSHALVAQCLKITTELSREHLDKNNIIALKFDGKKGPSKLAHCKQKIVEKITCIMEPTGAYLDHFEPESGSGYHIAVGLFNILIKYDSVQSLLVIGGDNCPTNTGPKGGACHYLEFFINRNLSRALCLLHFIELPIKVFLTFLKFLTISAKKHKKSFQIAVKIS